MTNAGKQSTVKPTSMANDSLDRRGLEKKWDVLQTIWSSYEASSRVGSILVPIAALTIKGRSPEEIDQIIEGLRRSGCFAEWERKDRWYNLEKLDHGTLSETHDKIGKEYKELAEKYQNERSLTNNVSAAPKFNYKITYESREILINGKPIARPNFDGENDLVFNYLILNPNQKFTRKQIEEAVKSKLRKSLSKIVENLGFKKDLRKIFFNVSSSSIQFNNPVSTSLKLDLN